ncbi:MAG: DNA-formamidopyrimidine glycosylase [Acidobacteria bacterium RBG_16_68_9]|nr:MAG: DNA-formamidopyrimidine glycosylase [Acidobacteria bacterium RBG_16_68_9]
MPELPEVETIRRSLLAKLTGATIRSVTVRERRLRRPIARDFESRLRGRRVLNIRRRGKYLLFDLDGDDRLLAHLGMSGRLEMRSGNAPEELHDHVRLNLDRGRTLVFNDPRRFGLMRVGQPTELDEIHHVGPDPLAAEWSADRLRPLVRGRRRPIKNLLMDQTLLGGIGNIYANEMLYRAGIRPTRRARTLRRRELDALAGAMRRVLTDAVRLGGSSISDFRDGDGRPGYFQLQLAVYDRAGDPCPRCRTPIRRVVLAGRSSFYCRRCQR